MKALSKLLPLVLALAGVACAQTLTYTVDNYKVHQGDKIPPCIGVVTGYKGTDTWTQAVSSGYVTCSTTYTPKSAIGTYPYTASTSGVTLTGSYTMKAVAGTITVIPPTGNGIQNVVTPTQPAGMMQSMTVANSKCSAVVAGLGDAGATATTTNINCFLSTGRPTANTFGNTAKAFYLPCGVYTVNGPIVFVGSAIYMTGDGPDCTVIKLAQSTAAFSNAASPVDFFNFGGAGASRAFNNGFNEYVSNLSVEIGPGNPGTNAVNFIGSNFDSVRNVWAYFDDSLGACALCMNHAYPGETYVKNFAGYGGKECFRGTQHNQYNTVFEDITCENQSSYGFRTGRYNVELRNYFSYQNSSPAWANLNAGQTLINGELLGTGSGTALKNASTSTMYVRNITTAGYTTTMIDANGGATLTGNIAEHFSGTAQTLWSTKPPTGAIITPVLETPVAKDPTSGGVLQGLAASPDTSKWSAQMATCPASGVFYIPVAHNYPNETTDTSHDANYTGVYTPTAAGAVNMTAPACINHIIWNHATFRSGGRNYPVITTTGTSATPLIIDSVGGADTKVIIQSSSRTVVVQDGGISFTCSPNSTAFFEDVETQNATTFCNNENVYARALDNESLGVPTAVTSIAYVAATNTLTLNLNIDPGMAVGNQIIFARLTPDTWLNNTVAKVTNISGSVVTATWLGTHADEATSTETGGNYRVMYEHLICTGCNLWVLGYKTENSGALIDFTNANVEIDGGFFYPVRPQYAGTAAFYLTDSNAFFTGQFFATTQYTWNNFVQETKLGVVRTLANPGTKLASGTTLLNGFYSIGTPGKPDKARTNKGVH